MVCYNLTLSSPPSSRVAGHPPTGCDQNACAREPAHSSTSPHTCGCRNALRWWRCLPFSIDAIAQCPSTTWYGHTRFEPLQNDLVHHRLFLPQRRTWGFFPWSFAHTHTVSLGLRSGLLIPPPAESDKPKLTRSLMQQCDPS